MSATELSAPTSSFIGRNSVLADISERFGRGARLLTLSGPPGVGKTRLAVEFADRARQDGWRVLAVAVHACQSPAELVDAVAVALEVERAGRSGDALAERVGQVLAARGPMLIILDDCERVAPALAEPLARWLTAAPELRLLLTSQVVVGIPDEHRIEVNPLIAEEAAALFRNRASAAGIDLSADDAEVLARLVEQLDGLPLAIELAAARLRVFSPVELLDHLSERFRVLRSTGAYPNRRHMSLRAALDDAWAGLDEVEAAVMRQASVFAGGFSAESATAVIGPEIMGDEWLPDVLHRLCDRSMLVSELVEVIDERRFRMLASVRDFAGEKLAGAGERDAVMERFARWISARATEWYGVHYGPRNRRESTRLEVEMDNLLATRDWGREHDPAVCVRAALAIDALRSRQRAVTERMPNLEIARAAAEACGDPELRIFVTLALADVHLLRNDYLDAAALARQARDEAEGAGLAGLEAIATHQLGRFLYYPGQRDEAREWLERAISYRGDARIRAYTLALAGHISHWEEGPSDGTIRLLDEALTEMQKAGDAYGASFAGTNLGIALLDAGFPDRAREHIDRVLEESRQQRNRVTEKTALGTLGLIAQENGDLPTARQHYEDAIALCREIGTRFSEGLYTGHLGTVEMEEENDADALRILDQAVSKMIAAAVPRHQAMFARYARLAAALAGEPTPPLAASIDIESIDEGGDPWLAAAMDVLARLTSIARSSTDVDEDLRQLRAGLARDYVGCFPSAEQGGSIRCWELRHALRLIEIVRDRKGAVAQPGDSAAEPVIGPEATWLELPTGERIDLRSRGLLRRILAHLDVCRRERPGEPISTAELIAAGWPGERMHQASGATRLHSAIRRLRKLGMDELLHSNRDGYWLE